MPMIAAITNSISPIGANVAIIAVLGTPFELFSRLRLLRQISSLSVS